MEKIQIITTDVSRQQFWHVEEVGQRSVTDCMHIINVYSDVVGQRIEGFGGAFTESTALNYYLLSAEEQRKFIEGYFGESGLCYNLARTTINSCDFALGNYTYVEEGDRELNTFSIAHDEKQIIPMIKEAQKVSKNGISFLASPWSPPAFMKTTGEMNNGGHLKRDYYLFWAKYFVNYIKEYEEAGIKVSRITVQNEPMAIQTWDSCIYTAQEEQEFVGSYLGPALCEAGLSHVKILIWDHNKEEAYDRVKVVLENQLAREYTAGVAVHWYTGDHFEALQIIRQQYPEKEIFFTEGCVEFSRYADFGEVQKAEMYAHDMLGNLLAGANGILDWNLLLDEFGGPNHVDNLCAAPIMLKDGSFYKRLCYYYIGQFSRYIRAGAKKIATTRYTDQIETVGFQNPDGERVIVVLNRTENKVMIALRENGIGAQRVINSHSIATIILPK